MFIGGGVIALSTTLDDGALDREWVWSGAVALLGLISLLLFGTSRRWWLLPLGCALTTIGVLQVLPAAEADDYIVIAGVVLVGFGGPFVGLYLNKPRQWAWLIPGYTFWLMGGLLLLVSQPSTGWLPTLSLWLLAVLFLVIFAGNRRAWAFTLGYILWALGVSLRLSGIEGHLPEYTPVTWVFWAAALLFLVSYLRDSQQPRRLLAASVLSLAGALPLLLFQTNNLWYWLAVGVSAGGGLAWLAAWLTARLRRQEQEQVG
jgi:hypothetical protein